ncbi:MAG: hypothetical protein NZ550_04720 [Fimbriimonadales bacterium]|nr:hypothetical protein [Fimbriimonadales bacterium]MDW8051619.1 hypothetical protein [Armatimonadota bacterium]
MRLEYWYRPHRSGTRRSGAEPSGGTFWVYLHNAARAHRSVSSIQINGRDVESIPRGKGLNWYRLTHELIPPRTTAMLILNLQPELLKRAPIELAVFLSDGTEARTMLEPRISPVVIACAWLEGRRLTVVVRNDGQQPAQPLRLRVDGRPIRFRTLASFAEPGGLTFLMATLPRLSEPIRSLPLQVDVQVGEQVWMLGGVVRPTSRHFPSGVWGVRVWDNDAERQAWRERGFTAFMFDATAEPTAVEQRVFSEVCPREGVYAIARVGFPRPATPFLERHRHNPHLLAYVLEDTPDPNALAPFSHWHLPALYERVAKFIRDREGMPSIYLHLTRLRDSGALAETADIVGYDALREAESELNLARYRMGSPLEQLRTAVEHLRSHSEPIPFWAVVSCTYPLDERVWTEGVPQRVYLTPEEIRVRLWLQLSRGAKGVLWIVGSNANEPRRRFLEAGSARALRALPEAERIARVEQAEQQWQEALEEQARLNRLLQMFGSALLRMEWCPSGARLLSASNPRRLDVALLVGEHTAALWLTNLDYEMHSQGYRFRPQHGIEVALYLPRWLRVRRATLSQPNGTHTPIRLRNTRSNSVRVHLEALPQHVALVWLE